MVVAVVVSGGCSSRCLVWMVVEAISVVVKVVFVIASSVVVVVTW